MGAPGLQVNAEHGPCLLAGPGPGFGAEIVEGSRGVSLSISLLPIAWGRVSLEEKRGEIEVSKEIDGENPLLPSTIGGRRVITEPGGY